MRDMNKIPLETDISVCVDQISNGYATSNAGMVKIISDLILRAYKIGHHDGKTDQMKFEQE